MISYHLLFILKQKNEAHVKFGNKTETCPNESIIFSIFFTCIKNSVFLGIEILSWIFWMKFSKIFSLELNYVCMCVTYSRKKFGYIFNTCNSSVKYKMKILSLMFIMFLDPRLTKLFFKWTNICKSNFGNFLLEIGGQ